VWEREAFDKISEFYGFSPTLSPDSLFVRDDFKDLKKGANNGSKSVYFVPEPLRNLMRNDREDRLKIVMAGVKVLERKKGTVDAEGGGYRLLQEGIVAIADHIGKRKVFVSCQDFCNILGGGLVSFQTLTAQTTLALLSMTQGALICIYEFRSSDKLESAAEKSSLYSVEEGHKFYAVCWRGHGSTINVMCNKIGCNKSFFPKHISCTSNIFFH